MSAGRRGANLTGAKVQVVIGSDSSQARGDMRSFGQTIQDWGRRAAVAGSLLTIALTGPIAMLGKTMVGGAMLYEESMNIMQATTRASAEEMTRLGDKAKELAADFELPGTEANNVADAMLELSKAGFETQETIDSVRGVIELSIAANMDYAESARIIATNLRTFGLAASESERVTDLLAAGTINSAAQLSELAAASTMASGTFADVNIPIEQLVASLALLADRGLHGSRAGTGLNRAILDLVSPSDKAQKAINELGISVFDTQGAFRTWPDIIGQFSSATENMTDAQRTNALATVFQDRAFRAMVRMIEAGPEELARYEEAITQGGEAGELAAARMKGLGGAIELLRSQWASVALEFGEPFLEPVADAIRAIAMQIPRLLDIPTPFLKAAGAIALVLAALGPLLLLISTFSLAIGLLSGTVGIIAAALAGLAVLLTQSEWLWTGVRDSVITFIEALRGIWIPNKEFVGMNTGLDRADKNLSRLGKTIRPVHDLIGRFGLFLRNFFIESFHLLSDAVTSFRQAASGDWVDSDEILALHRIFGGLGLALRSAYEGIRDFVDSFNEVTGADSIIRRLWNTFSGFMGDTHAVLVVLTGLIGVLILVKLAAFAVIAPFAALGLFLFGAREKVSALGEKSGELASRFSVMAQAIQGVAQRWMSAAGFGGVFQLTMAGITGVVGSSIALFTGYHAEIMRGGGYISSYTERLTRLWSAFRNGTLMATPFGERLMSIGRSIRGFLAPSLGLLANTLTVLITPLGRVFGLFRVGIPGISNMATKFAALPGVIARVGGAFNNFIGLIFSAFAQVSNFGRFLVQLGSHFAGIGSVIARTGFLWSALGTSLIAVGGAIIRLNGVIWNFTSKALLPMRGALFNLAVAWQNVTARIAGFAGSIPGLFSRIATSFTSIITLGGRLTPVFTSLGAVIRQAVSFLAPLANVFTRIPGAVGPALRILMTFGRPIFMLLGPIGLLIGAISAVVGLFKTDWRAIGDEFMPVVNTIMDGLGGLKDLFVDTFSGLRDAFDAGGLSGLMSELPSALGGLAGGLGGFGLDVLSSLFGDVDYSAIGTILLDGLVAGIESTLGVLSSVADTIAEFLAGVDWTSVGASIAGGINDAITAAWDGLTTVHDRIFNSVSEGIAETDFGTLGDELRTAASDMFTGMWDELTAPDTSGLLSDAAKGVEGPLSSVGSLISDTVVPALSSLWSMISSRVMPTFDIWKASLSEVWQIIGTELGPTISSLSSMLSAVVPVLAVVGGAILAIVGGALNVLLAVIGTMLPYAIQYFFTMVQTAAAVIQLAAMNIMTLITGLVDFVTAVVQGDWSAAWSALSGIVTGIFQNMVTMIPTILSGLWSAVKTIFMALVDGVIALVTSLVQTVVGNSLIPDMVNSIIEWIALLPIRVLEFFVQLVTSVVETVSGFVLTIIEFFMNLVTTVVETIAGFVASVVAFFVSMVTQIIEAVSGLIASIIEFFVNLGVSILETVTGFIAEVVAAFVEFGVQVVEAVAEFIASVIEAMVQFAVDMYDKGVEVMQGVIDGAVSLAETVIETFKQPITDALAWIGTQYESFKSSGVNLVQGIIDGIASMAGEVWEAGKDAGAEALSGLKFWESSPWPAAIPVGANAVLGLVQGMSEAEQEALDKAVSIATNILDLFRQTMEFFEVAVAFQMEEPPTHVLAPLREFMQAAINEFHAMGLSFSEEAKENLDRVTDAISSVIGVFSDAFSLVKDLTEAEFRIDRFLFLDAITELKHVTEHAVESLGWSALNLEVGLAEGAARIGEAMGDAFGGLAEALSFVKDLTEMEFNPSRDMFDAVSFVKFLGEHAIESLGWTARQFERSFVEDAQIIGQAFSDAFGGLSEILSFAGEYRDLDPQIFGDVLFDAVSSLKFLGEHAVESLGWTAQQFDRAFVSRAQDIGASIKDAFGGLAEALSFVSDLLEVTTFRSSNTQPFFDAVSFLKFLAEHAIESLSWSAHQFESKVYPLVKEFSEGMKDAFGGLNEALNFVGNILDFDVQLDRGSLFGKANAIANYLIELGTRIMVQMHRVAEHFGSDVFERSQEVGETMAVIFGPLSDAVDFLTKGIKLIRSGHLNKIGRQFVDQLINMGLYIMQKFYEASQRIGQDAAGAAVAFSESFGPLFGAVDEVLSSAESMERIIELRTWMQDIFLENVRQIMETVSELAELADTGESDADRFQESMRRIMETLSNVPTPNMDAATSRPYTSRLTGGGQATYLGAGARETDTAGQTINVRITVANGAVQVNTTDNENLGETIGDEIAEEIVEHLLRSMSAGPTVARRTLPGAR